MKRLKEFTFVFISFLWMSNVVYAQQKIDSSAHQLDSILIVEKPIHYFAQTDNLNKIKSNELNNAINQDGIASLLQHFFPVQINSYGIGNLSSISVRGGNDDHTSVTWNGIYVNSLTLGGADLSLIPALLNGKDAIILDKNTSNFGGNLSIQSNPDFENKLDVYYRSNFKNFSSFENNLGIRTGNNKVQWHSSLIQQAGKLNYPYLDVYKFSHPIDTIKHNQLNAWSAINSIYIQLKKQQQLSFGNWYIKKDKEIPSIMGTNEVSSKYQKDASVKSFLNYKKQFKENILDFSFSHAYDYMKYTDKRLPTDTFLFIDSKYISNRFSNALNYSDSFAYHLTLKTGYTYNLNVASVKEYGKKIIEHTGNVYAELNWQYRFFKTAFEINQPIASFKYLRPQLYVSAAFNTGKKINYTVQFTYADKYHFPDMNDRYWIPGGNPNLAPETGWTANMEQTGIFTSSRKRQEKIWENKLAFGVDVYYSKINNNIIWIPSYGALWSPKNIKTTQLYGATFNLQQSIKQAQNFLFSYNIIYDFNRALILKDETNNSINGNFLRYNPQHALKINFYIEQKYIGIGANYTTMSKRYTDEENIEIYALKPYHLLDVYINFKATIQHQHTLQFLFKINNITNTAYESIRSYAQPLRHYAISIIYHYSKNQNQLK
ncbi:MAG: hypothetical protein KDD21_08935 [Bacteroidetes bacterium]|nr:hypothetical protein [Bacteroidota bacterium]